MEAPKLPNPSLEPRPMPWSTGRPASAGIPVALAGAVVAGGLGGAIWALVAIFTGYEVGFVAWVIGGLAGYAVVLIAQGRKGIPLQVMAVLGSLLGILIGKYLTFVHLYREAMAEEGGAEAAARIGFLSADSVQVFFGNLSAMVGGFDLLWVALAVATAWRIPKATGGR